jgi:hypothetical protein
MRTFVTTLVLMLLPAIALAGPSCRTVSYPGQATMHCGMYHSCMVMLDPADTNVTAYSAAGCDASDKAKPCLWRFDATPAGVANPAVLATPNFPRTPTSLTIFTKTHTYVVELDSSPFWGDDCVQWAFSMPNASPDGAPVAGAASPAPPTPEDLSAAVVAAAIATHPEPSFDRWEVDYRVDGHADFKPLWVATDGSRTFVALPARIASTPTFFAMHDGAQTTLDPVRRGRMMIFDSSPDHFVMEVGSGKQSERIDIWRLRS